MAELLKTDELALDPDCGVEAPRRIALIDESVCIGCIKCILACPVDAIIGAGKRMHTVIAEDCTGCELCIAPCPVDCIELINDPRPDTLAAPAHQRPETPEFRVRYEAHQAREQRREQAKADKLAAKRRELLLNNAGGTLAAAVARAKAKRSS